MQHLTLLRILNKPFTMGKRQQRQTIQTKIKKRKTAEQGEIATNQSIGDIAPLDQPPQQGLTLNISDPQSSSKALNLSSLSGVQEIDGTGDYTLVMVQDNLSVPWQSSVQQTSAASAEYQHQTTMILDEADTGLALHNGQLLTQVLPAPEGPVVDPPEQQIWAPSDSSSCSVSDLPSDKDLLVFNQASSAPLTGSTVEQHILVSGQFDNMPVTSLPGGNSVCNVTLDNTAMPVMSEVVSVAPSSTDLVETIPTGQQLAVSAPNVIESCSQLPGQLSNQLLSVSEQGGTTPVSTVMTTQVQDSAADGELDLGNNSTSSVGTAPLILLAKNKQNGNYEACLVVSSSTIASCPETGLPESIQQPLPGPSAPEPGTEQSTPVVTRSEDKPVIITIKQPDSDLGSQIESGINILAQPLDRKNFNEVHVCRDPSCGRIFSSAGHLRHHQSVHDSEAQKNMTCSFEGCGRKFAFSNHLRYHQLTHLGARLFPCPFQGCSQSFYTAQRLSVHSLTHTGIKPFSCLEPGCGQSFTTAGNLKNHTRVHSGERPYQCPVASCSRRFAEYSSLKKHGIVHKGVKPYSCPYCDRQFTQSGSRNAHIRNLHPSEHMAAQANQVTMSANTPTIAGAQVIADGNQVLIQANQDQEQATIAADESSFNTNSEQLVLVTTDASVSMPSGMLMAQDAPIQESTDQISTNSATNLIVLSTSYETPGDDMVTNSHIQEESHQRHDSLYTPELLQTAETVLGQLT